jgi:hypothetical protein
VALSIAFGLAHNGLGDVYYQLGWLTESAAEHERAVRLLPKNYAPVTLEVEGIDRMYLNVYQPNLQTAIGVASFFRYHRGLPVPSSNLMGDFTREFVWQVDAFVEANGTAVVSFVKGQCNAEYRARFTGSEGVLFVGKAQEKTSVFRTEKRTNPTAGCKYAWIVKSMAMVNSFTSTPLTTSSVRSFSSPAATAPTTPSCASTVTNTSSGNCPSKASPSRRWTTAFQAVPIPKDSGNCATVCHRPRLRPYCAND